MDELFGITEILERKITTDAERGETGKVDDKAGTTETRIERV